MYVTYMWIVSFWTFCILVSEQVFFLLQLFLLKASLLLRHVFTFWEHRSCTARFFLIDLFLVFSKLYHFCFHIQNLKVLCHICLYITFVVFCLLSILSLLWSLLFSLLLVSFIIIIIIIIIIIVIIIILITTRSLEQFFFPWDFYTKTLFKFYFFPLDNYIKTWFRVRIINFVNST